MKIVKPVYSTLELRDGRVFVHECSVLLSDDFVLFGDRSVFLLDDRVLFGELDGRPGER